jgi:TolB protein
MLVFGATVSARTTDGMARPRTVATVGGPVDALAQNGRRIVWIRSGARCGRQVQILTLPGRRPVYVGSWRKWGCARRFHPTSPTAVGDDGRVLWQAVAAFSDTQSDVEVFTAAPRAAHTRLVVSDADYGGTTEGLPMAADGNAILFFAWEGVARREGIYRLLGRRSRRLVKVTERPVGLAVDQRRFAIVTNHDECCNFTPAWSHDGMRLAWSYRGDLWTIRADGTGERRLAAGASLPSWSPDDRRLVFEREEARGQHAVYRVDAAGRGLRRLAAGSGPVWSPDGMRIAFVRGNGVFAIDPDGRSQRKLTTIGLATAGPLSWSPDSTRIAVSRGGFVFSIRSDGTGETRLTQGREPAWSPNGAKLAYTAGGIGVVNADGTGASRLTTPEAIDRAPAWSPDSSRIAFVRGLDGGTELWVMNADGTGQRRLARNQSYLDAPRWSPNAALIVVGDYEEVGNPPGRPAIRLVSPTDGKATAILRSTVAISDVVTGRRINSFTVNRHARAIALGRGYVALLVDRPGVRVEIYNRSGVRTVATTSRSVGELSAAGRSVVFADRGLIRRLDARTGAVSVVAKARGRLVGPNIEGRRVVWVDNTRGIARVRAVTVP